MDHSVHTLASLAGISVRTLHYYDEIGLLSPKVNPENGYRQYNDEDLLKLQQILFFRELEFPLSEIKAMLSDPIFNREKALEEQKKLLQMKRDRLNTLIHTVETMIEKGGERMTDDQKFTGFSTDQMDQYKEEAKKRWGHTDAWKQSQERMKNWTKEDYEKVEKETTEWTERFASLKREGKGVDSSEVQIMIETHFNNLRRFYEPSFEMYEGLGEMIASDPRFVAYYDKHEKGLAQFMRDAMVEYVKNRSK